ncbi:hypothetical protein EVA_15759, partial [gut metagenome]
EEEVSRKPEKAQVDFPIFRSQPEPIEQEAKEEPKEEKVPDFKIHREEPGEEQKEELKEEPKSQKQSSKNPRSSAKEIQNGIVNIQKEIHQQETTGKRKYQYPPLKLLKRGDGKAQGDSDAHLRKTAQKLQETLHNFGVNVTVTNVSCGPTVTRYELQPEMGVKVSKIVSLADDIKLNLATPDIRIEAPIPGKAAVGIEVPNKENSAVMLRDLLQSQEFQGARSKLSFAAGKDIGREAGGGG